jgi:hypothetical protein
MNSTYVCTVKNDQIIFVNKQTSECVLQLPQGGGGGGGVSQLYVDQHDAATLASANSHSDSHDATTLSSANSHSDANDATTLASAKSYADHQDAAYYSSASTLISNIAAAIYTYVDAHDGTTLSTANAHSDANDTATLNAAKTYTDNSLLNITCQSLTFDPAIMCEASCYSSLAAGTANFDIFDSNFRVWNFVSGANTYAYFYLEVPRVLEIGTDLTPHIAWCYNTQHPTYPDNKVTWQIFADIVQANAAPVVYTSDLMTFYPDTNNVLYKNFYYPFTPAISTTGLSHPIVIHGKIQRFGLTDTYADKVWLNQIGFHYPSGRIGT